MRPSFVRSKTAPQASSSRARAGASLACSSAIRQLLTYCPPRIVSAKWTCQLSRSSTLPSAAAIPPSAITVCALPNNDLQTIPTFTPAADASIAARRPAPPAPMTRPDRAEPHVNVGERNPEQAHPGPEHVPAVEAADAGISAITSGGFRELIEKPTNEMPQRVTTKGIASEQNNIYRQHQRSDAHS